MLHGEVLQWRDKTRIVYVVSFPPTKDGTEAAVVQMLWSSKRTTSYLYCHYCRSETCADVERIKMYRESIYLSDCD